MNKSNISSRFSLNSFNRYALVIQAALKAYPGAISFDPRMKVDSYKQRCRDAITGAQRYGWADEHEVVDKRLFDTYADLLVVASKEDQIVIGGHEAVKNGKATAFAVTSIETPVEVITENKVFIDSLCQLLSNKVFRPQPRFIVSGLSQDEINVLESRFDVAFAPVDGDATKWEVI